MFDVPVIQKVAKRLKPSAVQRNVFCLFFNLLTSFLMTLQLPSFHVPFWLSHISLFIYFTFVLAYVQARTEGLVRKGTWKQGK